MASQASTEKGGYGGLGGQTNLPGESRGKPMQALFSVASDLQVLKNCHWEKRHHSRSLRSGLDLLAMGHTK